MDHFQWMILFRFYIRKRNVFCLICCKQSFHNVVNTFWHLVLNESHPLLTRSRFSISWRLTSNFKFWQNPSAVRTSNWSEWSGRYSEFSSLQSDGAIWRSLMTLHVPQSPEFDMISHHYWVLKNVCCTSSLDWGRSSANLVTDVLGSEGHQNFWTFFRGWREKLEATLMTLKKHTWQQKSILASCSRGTPWKIKTNGKWGRSSKNLSFVLLSLRYCCRGILNWECRFMFDFLCQNAESSNFSLTLWEMVIYKIYLCLDLWFRLRHLFLTQIGSGFLALADPPPTRKLEVCDNLCRA